MCRKFEKFGKKISHIYFYSINAYLIKTRERAYKDKTLSQIVKEMFSYSDGKCVKNYYYYKG